MLQSKIPVRCSGELITQDRSPSSSGKNGWTAQLLSCCFGTKESLPGSFDEQVPFELGNRDNDGHGHLASRRCEIDTTQSQAMNLDVHGGELLHGSPNIHRIASKPIELDTRKNPSRLRP